MKSSIVVCDRGAGAHRASTGRCRQGLQTRCGNNLPGKAFFPTGAFAAFAITSQWRRTPCGRSKARRACSSVCQFNAFLNCSCSKAAVHPAVRQVETGSGGITIWPRSDHRWIVSPAWPMSDGRSPPAAGMVSRPAREPSARMTQSEPPGVTACPSMVRGLFSWRSAVARKRCCHICHNFEAL